MANNDANDVSSSDADRNNIYEVSRILSQGKEHGVTKYLVEWIGYSVERASWEPIESFEDARGVLDDWKRRRRLERDGEAQPFDFDEWERLKKARKQRIAARRAREKDAARLRKQQTVKSVPAKPLQGRQSKNLDGFVVPDSDPEEEERPSKPLSRQSSIPRKPLRKRETMTKDNASSDDRQDRSKADQSKNQNSDPEKVSPKRPKQQSEEAAPSRQSSKSASFVDGSAIVGKSKAAVPRDPPHKETKKDTLLPDADTAPSGGLSGVARPTLPGASNANIFNNWADPNKRKARSRPELAKEASSTSDLFGSLSERRRFEKFGHIDRLPKERTQESSLDSLFVSSQENFDDPNFQLLIESAPEPPTSDAKMTNSVEHSIKKDSQVVRAPAMPPMKIPLTCYKWATPGERCPNARTCLFLHEDGYRLSDRSGYIPPKFLNPPQTCWYWWNTKCGRNSDDCNFAHHNTGLIGAMPDGTGKPTVVDLSEVPLSRRKPLARTSVESMSMDGQERVQGQKQRWTCWHWWNARCGKSRYDCKFAHYATGLIAPLSQGEDHVEPLKVAIDKVPPRNKSAFTCHYWFKGHCRKSDEQCVFSHYNTGWLARIGETPIPLDLEMTPEPSNSRNDTRSNSNLSTFNNGLRKMIACRFWKEGICRSTAAECDFIHGPSDVRSSPPDEVMSKPRGIHLELDQLPDAPPPLVRSPSPLEAQALPKEPANAPGIVDSIDMPNQRASPLLHTLNTPSKIVDATILLPSEFGAGIVASSTSTPLPVKLYGLNEDAATTLLNITGLRPEFTISTTCLVDDMRTLAFQGEGAILANGSISPTAQSSADIALLADALRAHGAYGVTFHAAFTVIFNTVVSEAQLSMNPSAILAFQIVKPLANHTSELLLFNNDDPFDPIVDTPLQTVFRARFGLTPEYIFKGSGPQPGQLLDKQVFLIINPTAHSSEALTWTSFLEDSGAVVYTNRTAGAWEFFVQNCERGAVLVHRDFYSYHQVPLLHRVLAHSVNFFRMEELNFGYEAGSNFRQIQRPLSRLFPTGNVILITDDLFAHHPNHAYDIMKIFQVRQLDKRRTTKVAGRPGLIPWLTEILNKALIKENNKPSKGSKVRAQIVSILTRCVPPHKQHKQYPPNPAEDSQLISVPPELDPTHDALWRLNEQDATNRLVEWFAGWCVMQAETFRRFVVVHPVRNPEWTKKYHHIHVVTPEECIEKYLLRA